jgi:hypothetical protein
MIEIIGYGLLILIAASKRILYNYNYAYVLDKGLNRILYYILIIAMVSGSIYLTENFEFNIVPIVFLSFIIITSIEVSVMFPSKSEK